MEIDGRCSTNGNKLCDGASLRSGYGYPNNVLANKAPQEVRLGNHQATNRGVEQE